MDPLKKVREKYPAATSQVYLDTATTGLFSREARDAMVSHIDRRHETGVAIKGYWDLWQEADDFRRNLAEMIGARPREIFYGKDSSDMMNVFAGGITLPKRGHVLIPDISFPSTRNTWLNLETEGFKVRYLKSNQGVVTTDEIISALGEDTFAVAICSVEPSSGYHYDLARLGKVCREKGIYFIVDATQSLGAMDLDVRRMPMDVMVASTYKWLCNVFGFGVGYIREDLIETLEPRHVGWTGVSDRKRDFNDLGLKLHSGAQRFETGGLNWVGLRGLEASVATYTGLGKAAVEAHIKHLVSRLYDLMETVPGVAIEPSLPPASRSSIVYLKVREGFDWNPAFFESRRIRVNLSGRQMRIGIHFYNNEADIDALIDSLKQL